MQLANKGLFMIDFAKCEKLEGGKWLPIAFRSLKIGDLFRMVDDVAYPGVYRPWVGGQTISKATSTPRRDKNLRGNWIIDCDPIDSVLIPKTGRRFGRNQDNTGSMPIYTKHESYKNAVGE